MVVENTGDGRRSDQPYLVFARMAELSDRSINIRHEENIRNFKKWGKLTADFRDYTDFQAKNEGWGGKVHGLGKMGKRKSEKK
jgi:hypothetical protein